MSDRPNVLIVGAGAIGAFYGAILKRAGCAVSVVLRSDYEAVSANGLTVESPLGDLSWRPDHVYRHDEIEGSPPTTTPDYVLLCVKVLPATDRVALVQPWMGPDTALVLIENGIDIEPELAAAYPGNPLLSCLGFVAVSRAAPGWIKHSAYGRLVVGAFPEGIDQSCRELAGWLEAGGIEVKQATNIIGERWKKCVWNTTFNPLSVLAGGVDTAAMLDTAEGGEQLVRDLMAEVCAVAAADGYPLQQQNLIDRNIEGTRSMSGVYTSMAQDYLNDRPIELEAILGHVVAIARRHFVAVPRLETVLGALRMHGL